MALPFLVCFLSLTFISFARHPRAAVILFEQSSTKYYKLSLDSRWTITDDFRRGSVYKVGFVEKPGSPRKSKPESKDERFENLSRWSTLDDGRPQGRNTIVARLSFFQVYRFLENACSKWNSRLSSIKQVWSHLAWSGRRGGRKRRRRRKRRREISASK